MKLRFFDCGLRGWHFIYHRGVTLHLIILVIKNTEQRRVTGQEADECHAYRKCVEDSHSDPTAIEDSLGSKGKHSYKKKHQVTR